MAEILPIRPWRYNEDVAREIETLTSPLFDVVPEEQRDALYQNPLNSIHLCFPQPPDPALSAAHRLSDWKKDAVIRQDKLQGIYVYYQYYHLAGSAEEQCCKGFVCNIKTYDWNEGQILRQENTIQGSPKDQTELIEKTEFYSNPTLELYPDPTFDLEQFMDAAIRDPLYVTEDFQGVRHVVAVIHDAIVIQRFISLINGKTIILADGLPRYEGSLAHKQMCKDVHKDHTGKEGYNYHLTYLCNSYGLPDESTYFHPHLIGGLVFSSIKEEEFQPPLYSPF